MSDDDDIKQMRLMERRYTRLYRIIKLIDLPANSRLPGAPPAATLTADIREFGLRKPIVLAANPDGSWDVLEGNRRIKSARELQWDQIEALEVLGLDDPADRRRWKVAANKFASENPMQVANLIAELAKAGQMSEEICEALSLTKAEIKRLSPLNALPKLIQKGVLKGDIALGTALQVVKMPPARQEALSDVYRENLTLTGKDVAAARQVDAHAAVAALDLGPLTMPEPEPELYVYLHNGQITSKIPIGAGECQRYEAEAKKPIEKYRLIKA